MKIVVINGTEKRGVTYTLKEIFLTSLKVETEVAEYYLPKDCPNFCAGCTSCFTKGETACKDSIYIQKIEKEMLQADLLVLTSPAYVMHVSGAMKTLLDHLGYRWLPHRPAKEMFGKRAVIITQCVGAGGKSAAKDIKHSLSWWGISYIKIFTAALIEDVIWNKLSQKKRKNIEKKLQNIAVKISKINYAKPARTGIVCRFKFMFCRLIQKSVYSSHPESLDGRYWNGNGWLGKKRPWKKEKIK